MRPRYAGVGERRLRTLRATRAIIAGLALAVLPAPTDAQPVGEEFQVNTYTTESQEGGAIASDGSGNFVVVWDSRGQDGSGWGVFGQRYDNAGVPQGEEFRVNSFTQGDQGVSRVASASSGNFVVVWEAETRQGEIILGQRFDSSGTALGTEFLINSSTTDADSPAVASDASGNFVVVWRTFEQDGDNAGIFGQRYDSSGAAVGTEFLINTYTTGVQTFPSVSVDVSGNVVVVWESLFQDGSNYGVFGQRFDSAGMALGSEFRANTYTTGSQEDPSVASDAVGNFVVVWRGWGQDGNGIFGQRYDSDGNQLGQEFLVNSDMLEANPAVGVDAAGNFVVAWDSDVSGGWEDTFAQRYDSGGVAQGDEFQVNTFIDHFQGGPSVAAMGTDQFVVTWTSYDQDGSEGGVFGQRYVFSGTQSITVVSPNGEVKWRIGALERIRWTHNLGADATFRIELDRDDDGDYEELIAAEAPVDGASKGSFAWIVSGPPSGNARVRVSWTDDLAVADASDVTFQIRPVAGAASLESEDGAGPQLRGFPVQH